MLCVGTRREREGNERRDTDETEYENLKSKIQNGITSQPNLRSLSPRELVQLAWENEA
jgi:hypothetical protein